jgi:hypothetical protein
MAFRSSATAKSNSGGNLTATPAGVQAGDYLGAGYASDNAGGTDTPTSSGWTQRSSADLAASTPDGQTVRWLDKVAAGGDSFTFTNSSVNPNILMTGAWSGRSGARTAIQSSVQTLAQTPPITAVVTGVTAVAGDDIVLFMSTDQQAGPDQWTYTPPSLYTEQQDDTNASWCGATLDTRDNVSAGATGNLTVTITRASGSNNAGWGAIVVAIAVAVAASPGPVSGLRVGY